MQHSNTFPNPNGFSVTVILLPKHDTLYVTILKRAESATKYELHEDLTEKEEKDLMPLELELKNKFYEYPMPCLFFSVKSVWEFELICNIYRN